MEEKEKKKSGRPEKKIDWSRVDALLEAGCSGVQIAPTIGVHYETLYDRCVKEFGLSFTDYSQEKKAKGEAHLKFKQYQEAIKGNIPMLVFLGKVRLKQREIRDYELNAKNIDTIVIKHFGDDEKPEPYQVEK